MGDSPRAASEHDRGAPRVPRREPVLRRRDWIAPAPPLRHRELLEAHPAEPRGRPPLLFVHGAWHGAWCFAEHWLPAAADAGWDAYAVSLRGHGGSETPEAFARVPLRDYEHDVLQAVTELPSPPVLVGHSMGGLVVQRVLERYRAAPAGVLLASVPPDHGLEVATALARHDPAAFTRALAGRPPQPRPATLYGPRTDPATARRGTDRLGPESWLATQQLVLPRRTGELTSPLLVLGGAEDRVVPPSAVIRTARRFGVQARLLRGMGHQLMLEPDQDAVLRLVLGWLDAQLGPPGGEEEHAR
ncbi:MAG: alpha/beta hydrolase [Nitriliruptoraceae bacterium]